MKNLVCKTLIILYIIIVSSCNQKINTNNNFEIQDFQPFINVNYLGDTLFIPMDLSGKITSGIELPSLRQSDNGFFKFSFKLKNNSTDSVKYFFRLFYQNESYKISEYNIVNTDSSTSWRQNVIVKKVKRFFNYLDEKYYNIESANNFYGSWGYGDDTMHVTKLIPPDKNWHTIIDSFKIVGNPRNEKKYFGGVKQNITRSNDLIILQMNRIKNDEEWLKSVKAKAKKNSYSLNHQLFLDALWLIRHNSENGKHNNRWKRNPRVGDYSFSIFVANEGDLQSIPNSLQKIEDSLSGYFINPYFDLFHNKITLNKPNFISLKSKSILKTSARFNLGSGIYSNEMEYRKPELDSSHYCITCGNSNDLFSNAQFEQHFHREYYNYPLSNVPISYDVIGDNYSQVNYNSNLDKYDTNTRFNDVVHGTDAPCKTVFSDTITNSLKIINPGNNTKFLKKENVALKSRIGFTYGKHIAKIKFPEILNDENVWSGLTCAYWLLYQNSNPWNNRMTNCDQGGYLEKGVDGPTSPTSNTTFYSEIDFEILKTSKYWPGDLKLKNKKTVLKEAANDGEIIIACTNWDLACKNPEKFSKGAQKYNIDDKNYKFHRWDEWYKAITLKHPIPHDTVFGDYYYYVIDWQPNEITWSIGKDENNLQIIAKADNSMTMVPDNQMIILFSQEFHPGEWWPLAPYQQNGIPYPSKDLVGEILEMRIE